MTVGQADAAAERDADRLADALVARVARPADCGTGAPSAAGTPATTKVRRRTTGGAGHAGGAPLDSATEQRIRRAGGGGRPLDPGIRHDFEPTVGPLDHVRVHTGTEAATISRQLDARAFAVGSDVFFGESEYRPTTGDGRRLIAHEVAHTTLEGGGAPIRRALSLNNTSWSDAKSVSVSDGSSATGVFFLKDRTGKTLVVKGAHGTERLDLAAQIVEAAGVEGVPQRMVLLDSKEGKKLRQVIKTLGKKAPVTANGANFVLQKLGRLDAEFDAVQVMESYENLGTLGALVDSNDADQLLVAMTKSGYFRQLGRLHAADLFMGNEDRLAHSGVPAIKNMFVNLKTGQMVALDLELNFHSFDMTTKQLDTRGKANDGATAPSLKGKEYHDFVNFVIDGSTTRRKWKEGKQTKVGGPRTRGGQQFTGSVTSATDPAKARKLFADLRTFLEYEANKHAEKNPTVGSDKALKNFDWATAEKQFMQGLALGNASLASKGESLAAATQARAAAGGGDPLADAAAIRIRTMYLKLQQMGYTDHEEIKAILVEYAKHLIAGGSEAAFLSKIRTAYIASGGKGAVPIMPALPSAPASTKVGSKAATAAEA